MFGLRVMAEKMLCCLTCCGFIASAAACAVGMTVRPRCGKITCSLKSDPLPLKVPALKLNTTHWLTTDGKFLLLDDVRYQCYTP
jgi:hypothetical protein